MLKPEYGPFATFFLRMINPDSGKQGWFGPPSHWGTYMPNTGATYARKIVRHIEPSWPGGPRPDPMKWPGQ